MSVPLYVKLFGYHGDTFSQEFRLLQGSTPLDLTGSTVECWAENGGAPVILDVAVGPAAGVITISAPPGALPVGDPSYDVQVTAADGRIRTWIRGTINVQSDVTHTSV